MPLSNNFQIQCKQDGEVFLCVADFLTAWVSVIMFLIEDKKSSDMPGPVHTGSDAYWC